MKKVRTYAVLISMAASASLLAACSDNDTDNPSDAGAALESPATQTPPATTPAPPATDAPPATTPAPPVTDAPPATTPAPDSSSGSATDITPEPDSQ